MLTMIAQTMVPDAYLKAGPVIGMSTTKTRGRPLQAIASSTTNGASSL